LKTQSNDKRETKASGRKRRGGCALSDPQCGEQRVLERIQFGSWKRDKCGPGGRSKKANVFREGAWNREGKKPEVGGRGKSTWGAKTAGHPQKTAGQDSF